MARSSERRELPLWQGLRKNADGLDGSMSKLAQGCSTSSRGTPCNDRPVRYKAAIAAEQVSHPASCPDRSTSTSKPPSAPPAAPTAAPASGITKSQPISMPQKASEGEICRGAGRKCLARTRVCLLTTVHDPWRTFGEIGADRHEVRCVVLSCVVPSR
jgi:hypothetical protein